MATNLRLLSLNEVKLVGRLTRDPELRYTPQGTAVCHMRIAVSRSYRDKNSNEWKEEVAFVPCTVWRDMAERCGQRLKKGSPLFVEGRLKSREWTTKEGQKRSDIEVDALRVQFLEVMGDGGPVSTASESSFEDSGESPMPVGAGTPSGSFQSSRANQNDDEVPF